MHHPTIARLRIPACFAAAVFALAATAAPPSSQDSRYHPTTGSADELARWLGPLVQSPREAFLKLLDRERVPVDFQAGAATEADGIKRVSFTYMAEPGQRVPGLWYQPAAAPARLPVVIILHGTGGNKEGMKPHLETYARAGFAAIAIDGRYHGGRSTAGKGSTEYQEAILRAWRTPGREYPFFFDTAWDVMRLIDYLETRPDVDAKRIGLTGFSKGGIETYLTAAADPRIAVAVPYIGVQSFRWALENNAWQSRISTIQTAVDTAAKELHVTQVDAAFIARFYGHVAPGIDGVFDGPAMLPLIAPRPLLVINGDSDARTPMPGLVDCVERARARYRAAGHEERLGFIAQKHTAHKVTPEGHAAGLAWFKRWLQPSTTMKQKLRP
ncbi:MAG: acetylxylan esterase [Opitutaceae bacterium]|nr:acetylxylan esterase [Opitutaceae bacterium]